MHAIGEFRGRSSLQEVTVDCLSQHDADEAPFGKLQTFLVTANTSAMSQCVPVRVVKAFLACSPNWNEPRNKKGREQEFGS